MSNEDDINYRLFQALNGGLVGKTALLVGRLPVRVRQQLGWEASEVLLTNKDTQKFDFTKHTEWMLSEVKTYLW